LIKKETKGGNPALYITNDPKIVISWENEARDNGLVADGTTVIYRFKFVIGADQGEETRCIRIDGDHGHPIVESGSKTSFDNYIVKAITMASLSKDKENKLENIEEFIKSAYDGTVPFEFKKFFE